MTTRARPNGFTLGVVLGAEYVVLSPSAVLCPFLVRGPWSITAHEGPGTKDGPRTKHHAR